MPGKPSSIDAWLTCQVAHFNVALNTAWVREVLPALTLLPLPGAPPMVHGAVDLGGLLVPVYDMQHQLTGDARSIQVNDHLVVLELSHGPVALHVQRALTLVPGEASPAHEALGELEHAPWIAGTTRVGAQWVWIQDPEAFLSPTEQHQLRDALSALDKGQDGDV